MAQIIRARPQVRDERRDGIVARARTSALRVTLRMTLPLRQRLALRRLIAAADAKRRRSACSGESLSPTRSGWIPVRRQEHAPLERHSRENANDVAHPGWCPWA
jgi:hypothetical protein